MSPAVAAGGNHVPVNPMTLESAYDTWRHDLLRYAASLVPPEDAGDVVADAIASVLRAGDARWAAVERPRAYLLGAVLNHARMFHRSRSRRRKRQRRIAQLEAVDAARRSGDDHPAVDTPIARAIERLTESQRAAVILTYWDDLTTDDVADVLGVSPGTVKQHLARARAALREQIDREDG